MCYEPISLYRAKHDKVHLLSAVLLTNFTPDYSKSSNEAKFLEKIDARFFSLRTPANVL